MPAYGYITPVIRWLSWVTPVSCAFDEFKDLTFDPLFGASGDLVIPKKLGGNKWLKAYMLPRSEFANTVSIKVFDIGMVFLFAVLYDILGKNQLPSTVHVG